MVTAKSALKNLSLRGKSWLQTPTHNSDIVVALVHVKISHNYLKNSISYGQRSYHILKQLIAYDKNGDCFLQHDELKDWLEIGINDWQGQEQFYIPPSSSFLAATLMDGVDKWHGNGDGQLSFGEHIKFVMSG